MLFILTRPFPTLIVALAIAISAVFSRSLYAILTSILALFIISTASDIMGGPGTDGTNYISFIWLVDAVLPEVFFNLEPLKNNVALFPFLLGSLAVIATILLVATLILRRKEVF